MELLAVDFASGVKPPKASLAAMYNAVSPFDRAFSPSVVRNQTPFLFTKNPALTHAMLAK